VLKKLRHYEYKLNARIQDESDDEVIRKLNKKIALVHAKRKKGAALLKELKNQ